MAEYDVAEEQQAVLALLADRRGASGWQRDYAAVLPGAWRDYLIIGDGRLEDQRVRRAAGARLLQTPGYARAIVEADPSLHDDVARDSAAEAVQARQQAILNKPG